jgi:AraC-like DNA-binding protein
LPPANTDQLAHQTASVSSIIASRPLAVTPSWRIERARLLLDEGGLSAAEVALAAGFSHQSHMARWMRRELGETPRTLLRKQSA